MISMKEAIEAAVQAFVERYTGVRPNLKHSKAAHLATGSFVRGDADAIKAALSAHASECTLFGAPLLDRVCTQSGWLLFFFTADAIDAYAALLPDAEEPDDTFFARRLWMAYRRGDAKTPDDPAMLSGFYAALMRAPDGEQRFLAAPRTHSGTERISIEQRLSRMAKILLWERRNIV